MNPKREGCCFTRCFAAGNLYLLQYTASAVSRLHLKKRGNSYAAPPVCGRQLLFQIRRAPLIRIAALRFYLADKAEPLPFAREIELFYNKERNKPPRSRAVSAIFREEVSDMSVTVGNIYEVIDGIAPFGSCMEWDNVGLLIGDKSTPVTGLLVTLDVTPAAVSEAQRLGANCIVSHHPVIFSPMRRLDTRSVPALCLKAGVSVISAHTNYDFAPAGVNYALACALGLRNIRPFGPSDPASPYRTVVVFVPADQAESVYEAMSRAGAGRQGDYSGCAFFARGEGRFLPLEGAHPFLGSVGVLEKADEVRLEMLCSPNALPAVISAMRSAHPYEEPAFSILDNHAICKQTVYGMMGELPAETPSEELALAVEAALETHVQYTPAEKPIRSVAVCGGAGAEYLSDARAAGAEAFLTGEVKHHEWFAAAAEGVCLMAGGHHATEHIAMPQLASQLGAAFPDLAVSLFDSNPAVWAE